MTAEPIGIPRTVDAAGLQVIDREGCFALLRAAAIGRVVFTAGALPAVLPVNFAMDDTAGTAIVVKTGSSSRLATSAVGSVVAFEVDEVDVATRSGWSVVVTGRLSIVRKPDDIARMDALGLHSWVPAVRDRFLRIEPEIVTGRRLGASPSPDQPSGTLHRT